jgi:hypothetical protein
MAQTEESEWAVQIATMEDLLVMKKNQEENIERIEQHFSDNDSFPNLIGAGAGVYYDDGLGEDYAIDDAKHCLDEWLQLTADLLGYSKLMGILEYLWKKMKEHDQAQRKFYKEQKVEYERAKKAGQRNAPAVKALLGELNEKVLNHQLCYINLHDLFEFTTELLQTLDHMGKVPKNDENWYKYQ